jgi:hypothetical protein
MYNCFVGIVVVAIFLTIGGVLAAILKGRKSRTVCRLELVNDGNVRSRYDLKAEDAAGELKFRFIVNGSALPQRQIVAAAEAVQPGSPAPASGGVTVSGVSSFASGAADLLYSLGYLLPRSIGAPLIQAGSQLKQGQYTAGQAERARDQVSGLAPTSTRRAERASGSTVTGAQPGVPTGVWVQTPYVEPGETLLIDLFIDPLKFHTQAISYPFQVMSRSMEQADAAWVKDEWTVRVDSLSSLSRNTPLLIVLSVVIIVLILAVAFCVSSTGVLR